MIACNGRPTTKTTPSTTTHTHAHIHLTYLTKQPRERKPVWPGRDYWNPLAKDMVGVEKAHLPAADLPFHDR